MNQQANWKPILPSIPLLAFVCLLFATPATPTDSAARPGSPAQTNIIPVEEIRPGMKGEAKTIFAGREVESFDVEVLGVLKNFFGPQQDIILVRLSGPQVDFTGVVSGMSGSPVYLEGRLAGALSLRFGIFTKQPIAGVTPIADMFRAAEEAPPEPATAAEPTLRYPLPEAAAKSLGLPPTVEASPAYLVPIETPLTFSGFY
ncbi:MAG: SpoIVB peptidase S55 domain-containing protein, partial [Terriglobia bacterium]